MTYNTVLGEALQEPTVGSLLGQIQHGDTSARVTAVKQSLLVGHKAIVSLGEVMCGEDAAAAKTAWEAVKAISYHTSRPGAGAERADAAKRLGDIAASSKPRSVRAKAIALIGAIGAAESVPMLAKLLLDAELREDARMALERIPGKTSEAALKAAQDGAPDEFKAAIELSFRHRRTRLKDVGVAR